MVFQPTSRIFADVVVVFPFTTYSTFSVIQCRIHEVWARFLGSSMKDDLRYTTSDCFDTFPFPERFEADSSLECGGKQYYEFRADLMVRNNEGLTKTYNRFHDPDERSPEVLKLRELHAAMDRAVLDAYGWTDLKPTCEFLLDYEEDEDESGGRRRKKPWRYRWPDDFRDEVLARLLELNRQRAEQERLSGAAAEGTAAPKRARKVPRGKPSDQPEMF
ncbi:MAG: type IIL restriction-modification enzyme MmeI [Isosphaeraceae bacterium]